MDNRRFTCIQTVIPGHGLPEAAETQVLEQNMRSGNITLRQDVDFDNPEQALEAIAYWGISASSEGMMRNFIVEYSREPNSDNLTIYSYFSNYFSGQVKRTLANPIQVNLAAVSSPWAHLLHPSQNRASDVNDTQSVHTSSVEKTAFSSIERLEKRYGAKLNENKCLEQIAKFKSTLTRKNYPGSVETPITQEMLEAAQRFIARLEKKSKNSQEILNYKFKFKENGVMKETGFTLKRVLALVWTALQDEQALLVEKEDAILKFIKQLYEIQRAYNLDMQGREIRKNQNDEVTCLPGTVIKLVDTLNAGVHPDVEIRSVNPATVYAKFKALIHANVLAVINEATNDQKLLLINLFDLDAHQTPLPVAIWKVIEGKVKREMHDEFDSSVKENFIDRSDLEQVLNRGNEYVVDTALKKSLKKLKLELTKTCEQKQSNDQGKMEVDDDSTSSPGVKQEATSDSDSDSDDEVASKPTDTARDTLIKATIKREIERVQFYPIHLIKSSKKIISVGGKDKDITITTKAVYDHINSDSLSEIAGRFKIGIESKSLLSDAQEFAFFRSDISKTFYTAFANPVSAHFAKETLEHIISMFNEVEDWGIKRSWFNGSKKSFFVNGVEIKDKWFPDEIATIIEIYNEAYFYRNRTWQDALHKIETILCKNGKVGGDSPQRAALHQIRIGFHDRLALSDANFKKKIETKTVFNSIFLKDFNLQRKHIQNGINTVLAELRTMEFQSSSDQLLALQYLTYYLFQVAKTIPFWQRGKGDYEEIMRRIAQINGFAKFDAETIKSIETRMSKDNIVFATRAKIFREQIVNKNFSQTVRGR